VFYLYILRLQKLEKHILQKKELDMHYLKEILEIIRIHDKNKKFGRWTFKLQSQGHFNWGVEEMFGG
jgi:hypothetical protein